MFCASCGSEYSQKLNYCKQCGAELFAPEPPPHIPRIRLVSMFWAVAAFAASGLAMSFFAYITLAERGLRAEELMVPFVLSLGMTGFIAFLMIWQLSRLVSLAHKQAHYVQLERPTSIELPTAQQQRAAQLAMPTGQIPSVVEHTTRNIAPSYRERAGHE